MQSEITRAIPLIVSSLEAKIKEKVDEATQELRANMESLKAEDEILDTKIVKCELKFNDEMKRKNLIIYGLGTLKDWKDRDLAVFQLFQDKMGVPCKNEDIDSIIKLDKNKNDGPVLVKFTTFRKKMEILANRRLLKDTDIYINEDYSKEVVEKRKEMKKIMKQLKSDGVKNVYLRRDKLWVDGVMWTNENTPMAQTSDADVEMEDDSMQENIKEGKKRGRSPSDASRKLQKSKKPGVPKNQTTLQTFFTKELEPRTRSSSVGPILGPEVAKIVDKFSINEIQRNKDQEERDKEQGAATLGTGHGVTEEGVRETTN